jgi:hypothetical protein
MITKVSLPSQAPEVYASLLIVLAQQLHGPLLSMTLSRM